MSLPRSASCVLVLISTLLSGCWQTSLGIPAWQVVAMGGMIVTQRAKNALICPITGCPADYPEGMEASVFSDGQIEAAPVVIAVDEWDRVYVGEGGRQSAGAQDNRFHAYWLDDDLASRSVEDRVAYYQKWIDAGEVEPDLFSKASDKLLRLEDTDGDGVSDTREVLAEFGEMPDGLIAGLMVQDGDVWVANIPSMVRLRDPKGGETSPKEVVATGFGVKTSLVGHDLHGPIQGPDGWLYFPVGDRGYNVTTKEGRTLVPPMGPGSGAMFRMRPDGSDLEVFSYGLRNPQDLAFDDYGNLFTVDNTGDGGDKARVVYVVEGGETGWAMPYQTLVDDYIRGPWMAERLWETAHESQPRWIVPPVAYLTTGPSGLAYYPGLGFPERYRGHFFVADYRYTTGLSGVWSFAVEPAGAGFRVVDGHKFIGDLLPVDVAFGYDGRFYVSTFDQFAMGAMQVLSARFPEQRADPRIDEVVALVREGMRERGAEELVRLLGHADQRIRLRAQLELARRGDPAPFAGVARDEGAALLPRLHAVWGLGQLGAEGLRAAGWDDLSWTAGAPEELRAQVAKVVGEATATWLAGELARWLVDPSERVRFFAAQSLGVVGEEGDVAPLIELLRENDDSDVFVRHAASFALYRLGAMDAVWEYRDDPSAAVRTGVLLALRRADDARVAHFLRDADPLLRVEAARAIYDRPIRKAMPALAAFAGEESAFTEDELQTHHAWHRRVIGAALAVGDAQSAQRIAAHAADVRNPLPMRRLALESLASFTQPKPRDLAMSWWRPLPAREKSVVHAALDAHGEALVDDPDLGDRALEIAASYDRLVLDDAALVELVEDGRQEEGKRIAALGALARRPGTPDATVVAAARAALAGNTPALRAEARDALVLRVPGEAVAALGQLPADASLREQQRAYQALGRVEHPSAPALVTQAAVALRDGALPSAVALDVVELVEARGTATDAELVAAWRAGPASRWALDGGNADRGRSVFAGNGDCARCHGAGGHGAGAGPPLEGVASRRGAEFVLESILEPQAEVADGYAQIAVVLRDGTTVGGTLVSESDDAIVLRGAQGEQRYAVEEIASRSEAISAMPPVAAALPPRELRDLMAYLKTL